jgi:phage gp46-like protein
MKKKLPDLHEQAFMFKNTKRFQHDGGRAWIGDSQLHEARRGANGRLMTIHREKNSERVEEPEGHKPSI